MADIRFQAVRLIGAVDEEVTYKPTYTTYLPTYLPTLPTLNTLPTNCAHRTASHRAYGRVCLTYVCW